MRYRTVNKRTSAQERGFVSVPDLLGAALVGGFLAYVGAQSFFLGDAIDARATSESAARATSIRAASEVCAPLGVESFDRSRFAPRGSIEINAEAPSVEGILGTMSALDLEAGAPKLLAILRMPKLTIIFDVTTSTSRQHQGNLFGSPGGSFVGRAREAVPCRQAELPRVDYLELGKSFFKQIPFGQL